MVKCEGGGEGSEPGSDLDFELYTILYCMSVHIHYTSQYKQNIVYVVNSFLLFNNRIFNIIKRQQLRVRFRNTGLNK